MKFFIWDNTCLEEPFPGYQEVWLGELKCLAEMKDDDNKNYIITLKKVEDGNLYFELKRKEC